MKAISLVLVALVASTVLAATPVLPKKSGTYQDGFALGKSRAVQALQELHDGKLKQLDENDEGECPRTNKDFCSGLFDGWRNTVLEGTSADQRVD